MKAIQPGNLEDLALGAAVLGTGGGGDPYIGKLMAIQAIQEHGPVELVRVEDIEDDALVVPSAMMGAPTVMVEKLPQGEELTRAFGSLEDFLGRKINYTTSIEAGGLNSTMPFALAAQLGLPLVDADGMGRAFPELQMVTPTLQGIPATPMAIADEKGNSGIIRALDNLWTEKLARTITIDMGCTAMIALYPMSGRQVKEAMVPGTVSLAQRIGETIRNARSMHTNVIEAVKEVTRGLEIFRGKVVDVQRRTKQGFAMGEATIEGLDRYESTSLAVRFQNENLIALQGGEVIASVPDLIVILDAETGDPITTEGLRYGFRVVALGIPCSSKWRTPEGLDIVGPRYFGYDVDYIPVEDRYQERISVG